MSLRPTTPPSQVDAIVEQLLGFRAEPTRGEQIEAAVRERMKLRALRDLGDYAALLSDPTQRAVEARALADRVTVNETYFFREPEHLRVLVDHCLTQLGRLPTRPLRILSVGCSTGEEPYSIALALREAGVQRGDVQIVALDASPATIAHAGQGRFKPWSLRNLPEAVRSRYFVERDAGYLLQEELRSWVRFEVRNVLDPDPAFWSRESFHALFCRNMLIYLTRPAIHAAIARFAQVLVPGGVLFLGHSETGNAAGHGLSVQQSHGTFYFVRSSTEAAAQAAARARSQSPPARLARVEGEGWADAIDQSTRRLRALSERGHRDGQPPDEPRQAVRGGSFSEAETLQLVREERFQEALASLPAPGGALGVDVLRAAILTSHGDLAGSQELCTALLALEPASAHCHYLLGLCFEQRGALREARAHHERAAALDDGFAMPRLRVGMLARRAGARREARRALIEAQQLMPHQDERTRLLFCGGFGLEALLQLCGAELSACGAEP
jgi:chemotaxis protein methyltransferase CheR